MDLKQELKSSAHRHTVKLLEKIEEIVDLPAIAKDAIRQELDYATMDGYRITMRSFRNGGSNAWDHQG